MDIRLSQGQLAEIGARYRVNYLVQQAGYTFGLAASDGTALTSILPQGFIAAAKKIADQLADDAKNKVLMAAEAKDATKAQNRALQAAKVWRRRVAMRAMSAKRLGKSLPDGLTKITQVKSVPAMTAQLASMTKLLEANAKSLAGSDISKLIAEGKALLATLKAADAEQELKRIKALPDAVRKFYAAKGTLYLCLKAINDAGQSLHADKPAQASRYNLSILHRRAGKKGAKTEPTPKA